PMLRKRARKACLPCHKRKVKCNGAWPCDVCQGYGYDCEYAAESEKPGKKSDHNPRVTESVPNDLKNRHVPGKSYVLVEVPNGKALKLSSAPFPESLISRYTTSYSAVAFPRDLGHSFRMPSAPRLHCFAWHMGTRRESQPSLGDRLFDQISLQDALKYANIYFERVHPVLAILDQSHAIQTCNKAWNLKQMPIDVEATVCGLVALGSLFEAHSKAWEKESGVVHQAQHLLEISVSQPPSQLSLKFVIAWVLRAVYLRCTSRPHLSWMASCNAIHLAEAIGLHQEFREMDALQQRSQEAIGEETAYRRRAFWIAISLNRLFSMEYGRSPLRLDFVSCLPITEDDNLASMNDFIAICEQLPSFSNDATQPDREVESLKIHMERLSRISVHVPPLALVKAEVCFVLYRRMRFLESRMTATQTETVLSIILAGLEEAQSLTNIGSSWWNVVGVSFQSVCVLLAIDNPASLALLPTAMNTLGSIARAYNTNLVREALHTAAQLIHGLRTKKMEEVRGIEQALDVSGVHQIPEPDAQDIQMMPELPWGLDWPIECDGGWMEMLFDPDMFQDITSIQ
ncbi:hypothetical protein EV356DRAFT_453660, partial [Viridothelium virens]